MKNEASAADSNAPSVPNPSNAQPEVSDGAATQINSQNAKMGPDANNTLANNPTQPETPGMSGLAAQDPVSPKQLSDSEKDMQKDAASGEGGPDAPKEAVSAYGGNFGNSVQDIYNDPDRRENQLSGPGRGELGSHGPGGTQGGYGNQYRADETYNGHLGTQATSSGGFRGGRPENNTGSQEQPPGTGFSLQSGNSAFGTQPEMPQEGTTVDPLYQNDNAAPVSLSGGFSEDYGHSSFGGGPAQAAPGAAQVGDGQRNQSEDYVPADIDSEPKGLTIKPEPVATDQRRSTDAGGRDEPGPAGIPNEPTSDADQASRSGYTGTDGKKSFSGDSSAGIGSRGGSYNDPNDNEAGAGADQATQKEYGRAADNQAPTAPRPADDADHGAPRRNAGRDNDEERK